jgi:CheY-like chemotaxis protein
MAVQVLVAANPELDERVRACLPGCELSFVRTIHEALLALRHDGFRLVVIDLHFDESRMFELLSHVRALPRYRDTPVVCVQGVEVGLSDAVLKSIDVAVKALGGAAFLDLRDGSASLQEHCSALESVAEASGGLRPS